MSAPAAIRAWEYQVYRYRRIWKGQVVGSLVQPLLYVLGLGIGVGVLVDNGPGTNELISEVGYFAYVAPAYLAAAAVMASTQLSLWETFSGFTWTYAFHSQHIAPLRSKDVANGFALWICTHLLIAVAGVAVVLLLFDDMRTIGLLPGIAFGVLTGLAVALPTIAWAASRDVPTSFPAVIRFIIIPMLLFAGVFYPVAQLPVWLQPVAYATPLWHGVSLTRGVVLGTLGGLEGLGHVAVLAAYASGGWLLSRRTFAGTLRK